MSTEFLSTFLAFVMRVVNNVVEKYYEKLKCMELIRVIPQKEKYIAGKSPLSAMLIEGAFV